MKLLIALVLLSVVLAGASVFWRRYRRQARQSYINGYVFAPHLRDAVRQKEARPAPPKEPRPAAKKVNAAKAAPAPKKAPARPSKPGKAASIGKRKKENA